MIEKRPVRRIGKYELIAKVAQGGMGALYKARHPTLDRVVLLKKLTLRGASQFVERFKREARLMMDFKHDHIVHVYDHFKEGSSYYIVEEFVDGISLDALIRRERYLSNDAAMLLLYEVSKALKYAHDKQVIHRDIKPSNILISRQGEVKLVDFGIATSQEETEDGLTRDGMVLGTPSYIPPEQIADARNVDKRADIYSLGVVLYEMLTGKTPFPGTFNAETISLIQKGRYTPPRRLNPRISPLLRAVVRKAMRARPRRRYHDLKVVIRLLERRIRRREPGAIRQAVKKVLAGEEIREVFRAGKPWVGRLVAALCVLALLAAGGWYLYREGWYYELAAPARYGALVASARISARYKEPAEIFIKPVLYKELASELQRVEGIDWAFRENRVRGSAGVFVLESRKLYLPVGQYRLKFSLEGELYWKSFYLGPRTAQRRALSTANAQEVSIQLGEGSPLPLQVEHAAFDMETGEELTASTAFSVYLGERWLPWSRQLELTSAASYRFRFEKEGYFPRTYSLVLQPYQTRLRLEAQLIPVPGTLRLESNAAGLQLRLAGSQYYFTGGKQREYRRLEPLQAGARELTLSPGQYQVSVQADGGLSRSLSVTVPSGGTATLQVRLDRPQPGGQDCRVGGRACPPWPAS
jgi:tRNA A-37 threonylcarbamoyl transferase component Bud32